MKLIPSARAAASVGILLVEVAQGLEPGVAGQRRVVEGHLGVEALEAEGLGAVGALRPDDGEGVDLDEVGVIRNHRPDQALGDRDRRLVVGAEAEREGHLAGLPVEQPEMRVGVDADDRLRPGGRDLLDLHAALGRAHEQDPPGRAVEDRAEVELADDVGGRGDEHLADRDALDVHAQDAPGDGLRLGRVRRELHAAGLAPPADEHLGLDDNGARAEGEGSFGGPAGLRGRPGDLPGGDRQALGHEEGLRVGFLDLHADSGSSGGPPRRGRRDGWAGVEGPRRDRDRDALILPRDPPACDLPPGGPRPSRKGLVL